MFSSLKHGSVLWAASVSCAARYTPPERTGSSLWVFELKKESTTFNGCFLSLNLKCHETAFFLFMVTGSRVYSLDFGVFDLSFVLSDNFCQDFRIQAVFCYPRSPNVVELAWTCVFDTNCPSLHSLRNGAEDVQHTYKVLRCDDEEHNIWSPVRKIREGFDYFCPIPS